MIKVLKLIGFQLQVGPFDDGRNVDQDGYFIATSGSYLNDLTSVLISLIAFLFMTMQ